MWGGTLVHRRSLNRPNRMNLHVQRVKMIQSFVQFAVGSVRCLVSRSLGSRRSCSTCEHWTHTKSKVKGHQTTSQITCVSLQLATQGSLSTKWNWRLHTKKAHGPMKPQSTRAGPTVSVQHGDEFPPLLRFIRRAMGNWRWIVGMCTAGRRQKMWNACETWVVEFGQSFAVFLINRRSSQPPGQRLIIGKLNAFSLIRWGTEHRHSHTHNAHCSCKFKHISPPLTRNQSIIIYRSDECRPHIEPVSDDSFGKSLDWIRLEMTRWAPHNFFSVSPLFLRCSYAARDRLSTELFFVLSHRNGHRERVFDCDNERKCGDRFLRLNSAPATSYTCILSSFFQFRIRYYIWKIARSLHS